jgi:predicted PurR-regulated permease PerM
MRSSSSEEITTWTTSQVVFATVFVVLVFLTFWLLYNLRMVLFLFFVAIVIGTAIRPAVEWLHRRGISRSVGVIIIYIIIAALIAGFLALVLPLIIDQTTQIAQNFPQFYTSFRQLLINSDNRLVQDIGLRIPVQLSILTNRNAVDGGDILNQVSQTLLYTNLTLKGILSTLAIFLLAYYWTQESTLVIRGLLRIFPAQRKKHIREFLQLAEIKLGGYIRGQGLLCLIIGVAAFIAYLIIGLPYTLVLAIFAGVMEMVPIFGPALGAVPALLVALSIDPARAVWVVVATTVIQMLENVFFVPRIMKSSLGVNPIIVLLSLIAFGSVFGFVGSLLALPLAALIQLLVSRVALTAAESARQAENRARQVQSLMDESQKLMETIYETSNKNPAFQALPEEDRLEVYSLAEELNGLLSQINREGEAL